jgi:hypothetical protein
MIMPRKWSIASLYCIVLGAAIASYLVLRQPAWREVIVSVVPHRFTIELARVRQALVPRSIVLSGVGCGLLLVGLALSASLRAEMLTPLARGRRLLAGFAMVQVVIAVAVVINLHAYYLRQYHRPVCAVEDEAVLAYTLPQRWPDVASLRQLVPPDARLAYKSDDDLYMLPALAYPLTLYDAYPWDDANWQADEAFARLVREKGITHLLKYSPGDRANPIRLRPVN